MVSTVFIDFSHRMDISLPTSKASIEDSPSRSLIIELTLDKRIFLNGKIETFHDLERDLINIVKDQTLSAIIKADKGLPYGDVVAIMGLLQAVKIKDISIAVK